MDIISCTLWDEFKNRNIKHTFGVMHSSEKIDIFSLESNFTLAFEEQAPIFMKEVLSYYSLSGDFQNYDWTYTNGASHCKIDIEHRNSLPIKLLFSNSAVFEPYCIPFSLEEYKVALHKTANFIPMLLSHYPEGLRSTFFKDPITLYLAYTPLHQYYSVRVLKPAYNDQTQHPVLLVDTDKFINYWKKQCEPIENIGKIKLRLNRIFVNLSPRNNKDPLDLDDYKLLQTTLETSHKHYIPTDMACGVGVDYQDRIRFTNGRHRTVNLAKLGAPFIPIQSSKEKIERLKILFEWI